jgi:alanine racemase
MRPSQAIVDLAALRRNLARATARAPGANTIAVIKANGYGHGLVPVAQALAEAADALAVATMDEARCWCCRALTLGTTWPKPPSTACG